MQNNDFPLPNTKTFRVDPNPHMIKSMDGNRKTAVFNEEMRERSITADNGRYALSAARKPDQKKKFENSIMEL